MVDTSPPPGYDRFDADGADRIVIRLINSYMYAWSYRYGVKWVTESSWNALQRLLDGEP